MTAQILPSVRPEFSVIIEVTGHFFSWATWKEFVKDTFKGLEMKWETSEIFYQYSVPFG